MPRGDLNVGIAGSLGRGRRQGASRSRSMATGSESRSQPFRPVVPYLAAIESAGHRVVRLRPRPRAPDPRTSRPRMRSGHPRDRPGGCATQCARSRPPARMNSGRPTAANQMLDLARLAGDAPGGGQVAHDRGAEVIVEERHRAHHRRSVLGMGRARRSTARDVALPVDLRDPAPSSIFWTDCG